MKVLHPVSKTIKSTKARTQADRKRKRNSGPNQASEAEKKRAGRPARACRTRPISQDDESEV